ncbi:hypothetical protein SOVF_214660, partial [Spinacia oleracea]
LRAPHISKTLRAAYSTFVIARAAYSTIVIAIFSTKRITVLLEKLQ